ncbi:MAG: hypothetical protein LBS39_05005, partial [Campylobacteraceae bacterium]|nr:hypothetical protein [Campylobacteraceae bacterium]
YLAANAFVKSCERVPVIKERLIFALFAVIISEIIGFVVLVFTALFAFDIFDSLELWTLLFLALIVLIKFLGIFYFFGFFGKIILESTKKIT